VAYEKFAAAAGYAPNPLSAIRKLPMGRFWEHSMRPTHNRTLGANPDEVVAYRRRESIACSCTTA
jgi:hypothetical protein